MNKVLSVAMIPFSTAAFLEELVQLLPSSSGAQREVWAKTIVAQQIGLPTLAVLLDEEQKVASRFLWLLSDLGNVNPDCLRLHLPYLLQLSETVVHVNLKQSMASYWLIAGVPEQNEGIALDWLLQWLRSPNVNATTKSRSLKVLVKLVQKHPAIQPEVLLALEGQLEHKSSSFRKLAMKTLHTL